MKRRSFFGVFGGIPAVAAPVAKPVETVEVYRGGGVVCSKCGYMMYSDWQSKTQWCPNARCGNFNKAIRLEVASLPVVRRMDTLPHSVGGYTVCPVDLDEWDKFCERTTDRNKFSIPEIDALGYRNFVYGCQVIVLVV